MWPICYYWLPSLKVVFKVSFRQEVIVRDESKPEYLSGLNQEGLRELVGSKPYKKNQELALDTS